MGARLVSQRLTCRMWMHRNEALQATNGVGPRMLEVQGLLVNVPQLDDDQLEDDDRTQTAAHSPS